MEKGSKFGRKQQEDAWQNTEVDALFTLAKAGVRVPEPYGCYEGVLLMELVTDDNGEGRTQTQRCLYVSRASH